MQCVVFISDLPLRFWESPVLYEIFVTWITNNNSLLQGRFKSDFDYTFQTLYTDYYGHSQWNCPQVNATLPHYLEINFGPGDGLVPSGDKLLPT